MLALISVLLLAALLFGALSRISRSRCMHFLWIIAAIVLVLWLIGFVARSADAAWYRW